MHTYRNSRNITGPLVLIASGFLLLSFSIWQMVMRPALVKPHHSRSVLSTSAAKDNSIIAVNAARRAFDQSQAQFLDLRDSRAFRKGHIAGAMNIPQEEVYNRLDELDHSRWLILYTTRENQPAASLTVQQLLSRGFVKANCLDGGFESWLENGNPTEP